MAHQANFDLVRAMNALGFTDATSGQLVPARPPVVAKTANYTIPATTANGTLFTNAGDDGAIVFTLPLPAVVPQGTYYDFLVVADQSLTITAGAVDTLIAYNDVAADSVAFSTSSHKIGALARVICVTGASAPQWACVALSSHTATVAT